MENTNNRVDLYKEYRIAKCQKKINDLQEKQNKQPTFNQFLASALSKVTESKMESLQEELQTLQQTPSQDILDSDAKNMLNDMYLASTTYTTNTALEPGLNSFMQPLRPYIYTFEEATEKVLTHAESEYSTFGIGQEDSNQNSIQKVILVDDNEENLNEDQTLEQ